MTSVQKTVFICDRCGAENHENGTIRTVGIEERSVLHDSFGNSFIDMSAWSEDIEPEDVCQECFDELVALWDVWMEGGDDDGAE